MDRPRRRRTLSTAAAVVLGAAVLCGGLASSTARADQIIAVQTPKTLSGLEAEAHAQRLQMARLESQMQVIHRAYEAAETRLTAVNASLSQTRLEYAQTQTDLQQQSALLGARLAAMYKMGSFTFLDVLAGSANLDQVQTQITFYRKLTQQDARTEASVAALNTRVGRIAAALTDQRAGAEAAQQAVDAQRLAMSDRIAQRRAILENLTAQIQKILDRGRPAGGTLSPVPLSNSYTPLTWAKALLEQLGMPLTSSNVAAVTAWELAEGGHWHNTAHYNPLDTTMPEPGATSMNSVGVKAYVSWAQGFTATIATLRNGYYGQILAALRAGDNAYAVADAVAASPWGTGNFSGLL
jgi:peptidoglycan hydrolase CwlO-like protein